MKLLSMIFLAARQRCCFYRRILDKRTDGLKKRGKMILETTAFHWTQKCNSRNTFACLRTVFACRFSTKKSTFLTFNFKVTHFEFDCFCNCSITADRVNIIKKLILKHSSGNEHANIVANQTQRNR